MKPESQAPRISQPSDLLRFGGGGFCLVAGLGIFLVGGYFSVAQKFDLQSLLVALGFGSVWTYIGLGIVRMRVQLGSQDIRVRSAFREVRVPYKKVAAIDVEKQGVAERTRLRDANGRVLADISNWITGYPTICASVRKRVAAATSD